MKAFLLINDVLDLFYPNICPGCDNPKQRSEKHFCIFCELQLPKTNFVSGIDNSVYKLFVGRAAVEQADAWLYFVKKGMVQKLMYSLKYKGNETLGEYLGYLYGLDLKAQCKLKLPECLCAVPLHPDKIKTRGFNQAAAIARGMSKALEIPFLEHLIIRQENKGSQTLKKRFERWESSKQSFQMNSNLTCEFGVVGLVDDVVTTGSTLEICANLLNGTGVEKVQVFALCQAIN
jgi:competence protein ComFC